DEIIRRMARNDERLTEILNNVKTLNAAPVSPPQASAARGVSASSTAGASADVAFQAAYRDLMSRQNQLAMDEFRAFVAQFPTSAENAPKAQYYMGVIYFRDED